MLGLCRGTGYCAVLIAGLALAGCSSPTMMLDAATTVAEDRTMSQVATDAGLKIDINAKLLSNKYRDLFLDVNTNVYENKVMLTGAVKTRAHKPSKVLPSRSLRSPAEKPRTMAVSSAR